MKVPYEKIQVKISMVRGYLYIKIHTKYGKRTTQTICNVNSDDLNLIFWGDEKIRIVQNYLMLSQNERILIAEGDTIGKYAPRTLINKWVIEKKGTRLKREASIERIEKILTELHKLFLRERRQSKSTTNYVSSDIIPFMDGSLLLWINVILTAEKDFLKGHDDIRRIDEWELMTFKDLLDENGNIKRGNEDAWIYITARDFLFDDNYRINLGDPNEDRSKCINCAELIENIVDSRNSKENNPTVMDPSMSHLRSSLSKRSGDPKLIEIYCKKEK